MASEFPQSLPEKWKICRLDDVSTIIDSLHKTPAYFEKGNAIVRVTDVQGGFLDLSIALRVTEDVFQEFTRRYVPKRGDIVFSRVGSYGNASYVNTDTPFCLGQNTALITPQINGRYLHLFLQSPEARCQIDQLAVGSTQKTISLKSISGLKIPVPPAKEIEAIAGVLGSLDDKIESNRRTSRTLERVARAIFRAWFVDFEPVKAKAAGAHSFLGMPQDAFDALPACLVESELGPVPEGWMVGCLGDVVEMRMERIDPSGVTARLPYVPIECISRKSLSLQDWKQGLEAQSSLQCFYRGDILFGAMRPYFHKVCLAPFDGTTRSTAFVLVPRNVTLYSYAALLVHDPSTVEYATQHSVGSTIPYAKWERSLANMPVVIPPENHLVAFEEIVRPMLEPLIQNPFENARLRVLRDYLLPKLLNGELRVKDASDKMGEGPKQ